MERTFTLFDAKIRWRPHNGFLETGRQKEVEDLAKILQLKIKNSLEIMMEAHWDMMERPIKYHEEAFKRFQDAGFNQAVWQEELKQLCHSKLC